MTTYGLLIFDGAEELDFTGPWEVFTTSGMLRDEGDTVVLIGESMEPVRCSKGMRVLPDHTLDSHPDLDVLLIPGGQGTRREVDNPAVIDWIRSTSAAATWTTSVCTGALLLHEAGKLFRREALLRLHVSSPRTRYAIRIRAATRDLSQLLKRRLR